MFMIGRDEMIYVGGWAGDIFTGYLDGLQMVQLAQSKFLRLYLLICYSLLFSLLNLDESKLRGYGEVRDAQVDYLLQHYTLTNLIDHFAIRLELLVNEGDHVHDGANIEVLYPLLNILYTQERSEIIIMSHSANIEFFPEVLLVVLGIIAPKV